MKTFNYQPYQLFTHGPGLSGPFSVVFVAVKKAGKKPLKGTFRLKEGFAEMLKGGVIMDVVNAKQAEIAEKAGACAVMALERVPSDIRAQGGVARMSDPKLIEDIR